MPSGEKAVRRMVKRLCPTSEPEPVAMGGKRRNRRDTRTRLGEKQEDVASTTQEWAVKGRRGRAC